MTAEQPRVLVSGATGFIGRALVSRLEATGTTVHRLVRGATGDSETGWGAQGPLDVSRMPGGSLEGLAAVVHLAGAPIASGRWTDQRRQAIRESRVAPTTKLAEALASCDRPPQVLVSGSAIGWYGSRGEEVLREDSTPGLGFLPSVCRAWEEATAPASDGGIRVVHVRTGMVLGPEGGALRPQAAMFRAYLGGRLGSGRQWVSWIALEDEVRAIVHALSSSELSGPVNLTSPSPVTNLDFTRALGRALHRRAVLPVPAAALRLAVGRDLADELLLASQRVQPARLQATGFVFTHRNLDSALAAGVRRRPLALGSDASES